MAMLPYEKTYKAGPSKQDKSRATNIANIQYQGLLDELARSRKSTISDSDRLMQQLEQARAQSVGEQTRYGELGDKNLSDIYAQLGERLTANRGDVASKYSAASDKIRDAYEYALNESQGPGQDAAAKLAQYAQQMGLQGAENPSLVNIQGELAKIAARTKGEQAVDVSGIERLGASQYAAGTDAINSAGLAGTQSRANLKSDVMRAIGLANQEATKGKSDVAFNTQKALQEIMGKMESTKKERGMSIAETMQKLHEARTDRERMFYQDRLQEALARARGGGGGGRGGRGGGGGSKPSDMDAAGRGLQYLDRQGFGTQTFNRFMDIISSGGGPQEQMARIPQVIGKGDPQALRNALNAMWYGHAPVYQPKRDKKGNPIGMNPNSPRWKKEGKK